MSSRTWVPLRPTFHVRIFAVSFGLVMVCLAGFLFGVQLEAIVPATGVIVARDQQELRTLLPGLVEPGWYEGQAVVADGEPVVVRMDAFGDGMADPGSSKVDSVRSRELIQNGRRLAISEVRFHRLRPGDELWQGQVVATIRADETRSQLHDLDDQLQQLEMRGETNVALRRQRDRLRDRLAEAVLRVPETAERWVVLEVSAAPFQAVKPGDVIASIAPIDPQTHKPLHLLARLDIDEKHFANLAPAQPVRLYSVMYNHRLHGSARARIEQLEPQGKESGNGHRQFHALAPVTEAPFDLRIGSTFKAEVVVGRKPVYRIILEH